MPCMCGDICCPSCGPAQGNCRCSICRAWATEGCEHLTADGEVVPEFQAEFDRIAKAEAEADDLLAADLEDYWRNDG